MYAVIYTKTNNDSLNEATGVPNVKVYHCKKKKLAVDYLRRRFSNLCKALDNKKNANTVEFMNSGSKGDGTWALIEYIDKSLLNEPGYKYTSEEFQVIRSQEILDLPNGPALKVE